MSSLLEQEIAGQGAILAARAGAGMDAGRRAAEMLRGSTHMVIAARGTSDNAARFAQYLFGSELRLEAGLAAPWLYRDAARAPQLAGAAVLAISQSGRSPDVVGVLAAARAQRRPTVAITNDPQSELATHADAVIPLLAGVERSVAATKSYLASLHAIVQIVESVDPRPGRRAWLERLPDLTATMAQTMLETRDAFDPLARARPITTMGRGLFLSTACETALKLRELSGIPAEAFSPPDFMHGPIAALHEPAATWLVAPGSELEAVAARVAPDVVVSDDAAALSRARIPVALTPELPDWVAAILAVIPGQAAGLRLAELGGGDVDRPYGLSKVTLTN